MFLLDDPGNNLLAFSTEAEAVAAASSAIESYRSECTQTGEWSYSVEGVAVYTMPDDTTVDDCADYGIAESGCRMMWESVEIGNDEEGYDYKLMPAAKENE